MDAAGNLYIAEPFNQRIRKVDTNGVITTVAGNGAQGVSGNGGPAVAAELSLSERSGGGRQPQLNLFIADSNNNCVRKVGTNGLITTVAGGVSAGFFGDGGRAVEAGLDQPRYVAVDTHGNLYISDKDNDRVRMVDPNGVITTVAGGAAPGTFSGDGGPAANAALAQPYGLTIDLFGNLYIADHGNQRVRRVDAAGVITTVAGTGSATYSGDLGPAVAAGLAEPAGVVLDPTGNLYIADQENNRIRRVDTNGNIATVAGGAKSGFGGDGGRATNASLASPLGVTLDPAGNLYIADDENYRVRKVALGVSSVLTLTNISAASAGNYTAIVSSRFGSVTSSVAVVTVAAPLRLRATLGGADLSLQLSATPGQTYILQSAASLLPPINWRPVLTNTADTNGDWSFTNAILPAQGAIFYRAASP